MSKIKIILFLAFGSIILTLFYHYNSNYEFFSLEYLKDTQEKLFGFKERNIFSFSLNYFLIYVLSTTLSFPGAAPIMSLAGGLFFGNIYGLLIVSFASSIGALMAFLISRYFLKNYFTDKFKQQLLIVEDGLQKEGIYYLFSLRLAPVFPFFLINILMSITSMKARTFYLTSQIAMLPGTFVYVNAGTNISKISTLEDILDPNLVLSFSLLAFFPLIIKEINNYYKKWKIYKR